jgi:hypothetical protein
VRVLVTVVVKVEVIERAGVAVGVKVDVIK